MDEKQITAAQIRALTSLGGLADRVAREQEELAVAVNRARMAGASWRLIGVALGVTTQAAWERFRQPDAPKPLPGQGSLLPDLDESNQATVT